MTLTEAFESYLTACNDWREVDRDTLTAWREIYLGTPKQEIESLCTRYSMREEFYKFITELQGFFFAAWLYNKYAPFSSGVVAERQIDCLQGKIDYLEIELERLKQCVDK